MHLFPGFVATNAAQNNKFPFPIPQLASLFGPLIGKFIGELSNDRACSIGILTIFLRSQPIPQKAIQTSPSFALVIRKRQRRSPQNSSTSSASQEMRAPGPKTRLIANRSSRQCKVCLTSELKQADVTSSEHEGVDCHWGGK